MKAPKKLVPQKTMVKRKPKPLKLDIPRKSAAKGSSYGKKVKVKAYKV